MVGLPEPLELEAAYEDPLERPQRLLTAGWRAGAQLTSVKLTPGQTAGR